MRLIVIMYLLSFCGCLDAWSFPGFETIKNTFTSLVQLVKPTHTHKNPDVYLFMTHIRKAGYPAEAHSIMTEDGYLLTLHRIPGSNGSPPVLLQHGLLTNSLEWIVLGKGKALAYLLADRGYDVWLGNFRGNTFSKRHISLSPSEEPFWDFSFHEMGIYDLPAMIKHIKYVTNKPLHTYIGHSMGASNFYIMASKYPKLAQEVQRMISLAPAVFLNHMEHGVKNVVPIRNTLKNLYENWNHNEYLHGGFMKLCNLIKLCSESMAAMWDYDNEQFNRTLLHAVFNNNNDPATTSIKTLMHFAQIIESGKFQKYDYGSEANLKIYNSSEPQEYNLRNITVPIALYYSSGDALINAVDVNRLYMILDNVVERYKIPPLHKFSHMAYMFAEDAPKLVYKRILKLMSRTTFNQKYDYQ